MAAHKHNFALLFIAFGTFCAILGTGLLCGGGFNSVMMVPTSGPYQALTSNTITTVATGTTATATPAAATSTAPGVLVSTVPTTTNQQVQNNLGHWVSLVKFYPELFNWAKIRNLRQAITDVGAQASGILILNTLNRAPADAYTRRHAGENAWIFALYFPMVLIVVILAFIAFFRKSGYTLSLVGVGLSAVMISFTLIVVVHYQAKSFVPQIRDAFTDCGAFSSQNRANLISNVQFGSLNGPAPRRAWLCKQDWPYSSTFSVAQNLVYGGASVAFVGFIFLLIGFAYLVHPFVTPVPDFAKNPAANASAYRGSSLDFDDYSDYSETEY